VLDDLAGRVSLVLDGGPASIGVESSVVDLTSDPPALLRPGGVPFEALLGILPRLTFRPRYLAVDEDASAPGMLLRHYAPDAALTMITGVRAAALARLRDEVAAAIRAGRRVGVLAFAEDLDHLADLPAEIVALGPSADPEQIAAHLFAALRELDHTGVDIILVRDPGREGLSLAIWDRLVRAAEGRVIRVEEQRMS
jgi:L-threonylcarbamoyladenylate synthase